jgi:hypothetical protein
VETREGLERALSKNIMFSHLEGDQLAQIFAAMFEVKYLASDIVFRQGTKVGGRGEAECEYLAYLISFRG